MSVNKIMTHQRNFYIRAGEPFACRAARKAHPKAGGSQT